MMANDAQDYRRVASAVERAARWNDEQKALLAIARYWRGMERRALVRSGRAHLRLVSSR